MKPEGERSHTNQKACIQVCTDRQYSTNYDCALCQCLNDESQCARQLTADLQITVTVPQYMYAGSGLTNAAGSLPVLEVRSGHCSWPQAVT